MRRRDSKLSAGPSNLVSRSPYNCSSGRSQAPRRIHVDAVNNDGQVSLCRLADFSTRAWSMACRGMKPSATMMGNRLLPQYSASAPSCKTSASGCERHRLAQRPPACRFRGRHFTERHETMIWRAREKAKGYTSTTKAEGRQRGGRRPFDWLNPLCTVTEENPQGRDGKRASEAEAPGLLRGVTVVVETRPIS